MSQVVGLSLRNIKINKVLHALTVVIQSIIEKKTRSAMNAKSVENVNTDLKSDTITTLVGSATAGFHPAAQIGMATVAGGFAPQIAGGDFLQGMASGLIAAALNHGAHALQQPKQTLQQQLDEKLKTLQVGESVSGKELAKIVGISKISWGISEVTRVSEINFKITRTKAAAIGNLIEKDAYMTITTSSLGINNVFESVFKIQINGLSKTVIGWGVPSNSYLFNNRLYFYENGKLYYY